MKESLGFLHFKSTQFHFNSSFLVSGKTAGNRMDFGACPHGTNHWFCFWFVSVIIKVSCRKRFGETPSFISHIRDIRFHGRRGIEMAGSFGLISHFISLYGQLLFAKKSNRIYSFIPDCSSNWRFMVS